MKPARVLLAVGIVVVAGASTASAATIKVTTTKDEFGPGGTPKCGLREAIQAANTNAKFGGCARGKGADRIVLGKGTYRLTRTGVAETDNVSGDLNPASPVTIVGKGPKATVIDGNGEALGERVFRIGAGRASFAAMTIRHGYSPGGVDTGGGAIRHESPGDLTLDRMRFVHNLTSGFGGAVLHINDESDLKVTRSKFVENETWSYGGGLYASASRNVTIRDSVFSANSAYSGRGGLGIGDAEGRTVIARTKIINNATHELTGGLYVDSAGGAELSKMTVSGNIAAFQAGGIYLVNTHATLRDSTISGNFSVEDGAGIIASGGSTTLTNSTVSGNVVSAANGKGGGIYADGPVNLRSSTIVFNRAEIGAGIYQDAAVSYKNSIIAGNRLPSPPFTDDCESPAANSSLGNNFFGDDTCDTDGPGDIANGTALSPADPKLDVLANYGGPTPTHALLRGSPAIDKGKGCPKRDQRGRKRKGRCDIGAFER